MIFQLNYCYLSFFIGTFLLINSVYFIDQLNISPNKLIKKTSLDEETIRDADFRFDLFITYSIEYIEIRKTVKGFGPIAN